MCAPRFQVLAPARVSLSEAPELAEALCKLGPRSVVLKLGDQGSYYSGDAGAFHTPTFPVEVRDTTAAGDTFNAALAPVRQRRHRNFRHPHGCPGVRAYPHGSRPFGSLSFTSTKEEYSPSTAFGHQRKKSEMTSRRCGSLPDYRPLGSWALCSTLSFSSKLPAPLQLLVEIERIQDGDQCPSQ
jgi:pfkB family carbohydrate kinase